MTRVQEKIRSRGLDERRFVIEGLRQVMDSLYLVQSGLRVLAEQHPNYVPKEWLDALCYLDTEMQKSLRALQSAPENRQESQISFLYDLSSE